MIPIARPSFGCEEEKAIAEVLRSGWVAQGPSVRRFEEEFAGAIGVPFAVATSSCTTALQLAMAAGNIQPGDEVILPSYTFPATANAVLHLRGRPVLVDVDASTLNVDVEAVRAAVTERTRAVIGVHLFGFPCEIERLRELCDERGLFLVEDAACAVGTEIEGRRVGGVGDVACFSLHGRKVVTCGEGGVLATRSKEIAQLVRSLRNHGADRGALARHEVGAAAAEARYVRLGYNFRLSDLQAAVARVQLGKLETFLEEREEIARAYDEAFQRLDGLRLPPHRPRFRHSYQSYVVVLEAGSGREPAPFREALAARGISTRLGTYAIHRESYFRELFPEAHAELPVSDEAARRSVALPMFNGMSLEERGSVIEAVREAWDRARAPDHPR